MSTPAPARTSSLFSLARNSLQQLLAFASLIAIVIVFSILSPHFFTANNIVSVLTAATVTGILALGTTFVIITGGIDLSIGTGMILCGVMTGVFLTYWGWPLWAGVLGAVIFGGIIGFINGFNVSILGIPPFIATLGMMLIASGLSLVISGTKPIYFPNHPDFQSIMNLSILPGTRFPLGVAVFIAVIIVSAIILSKTIVGRYAFSIGSNEAATELSGVNVRKWKIIIYTLSGLFVGLAGVLSASRLSSAQPTGGMGLELEAIAAVVIGGTSLQGGKGSIVGTVIGALIMAVLTNGLRIISVPQEWQSVAVGCVILIAVYLDMLRRRSA
ncbi:ribose transport system permease protein [Microbacteriaceae bacterium SG_E_30_P1]|uniref:Ribose transport system permease protein n=1 Tax=Antiquaquibacter oligotrophicus TaxID=2880260 RepID=A0ABT6KRE1_9MICO|nr:ABC transporter permease [Antiquaquibacter oligotrophicus]MDH6182350.1 ribose transport system permease protein [Antiquaquibacter oligotrophicus]UDF11997.1 ABC transporter permease [Antiquaquibacter oligotrophicus]